MHNEVQKEIDQLPPSKELLEYYKKRVGSFNEEINDIINRMDKVYKPLEKDTLILNRKVVAGLKEISLLQENCESIQVTLLKERQQALEIKAENDQLKLENMRKNRRIRHLLSLVQNDMTSGKRLENPYAQDVESGFGEDLVDTSENDEIVYFREKTQSLERHLEEQKQQNTQLSRQMSLIHDERAHEEETVRGRFTSTVEDLLDKIKHLKALTRDNTRDIIMIKKLHMSKERQYMDQYYELKCELEQVKKSNKESSSSQETLRLTANLKENNVLIAKQTAEIENLREMLRERENLNGKKIDSLQQRLSTSLSDKQAFNKRRSVDVEGVMNEVIILRRKLETFEKLVLQYGPVEDTDLLLLSTASELRVKSESIISELKSLKAKFHETKQQTKRMKLT